VNLFEQLIQESSNINRMGMDMIKHLMLQLFILVARQSENSSQQTSAPNYNYTLLQSFKKLNR
jgi:AraC family transcriptional activator of pobA